MWDRIRGGRSQVERNTEGLNSRPGRRPSRRPLLEVLEDRQLLTSASLQPIANVTVPSLQGYTHSPARRQPARPTRRPTRSPRATPISPRPSRQGPFWNVGVSYTDPSNSANNFTGTLTYQLFQNLTPNTVSEISNLTNNGYFVNTGKYFSRIVTGFRRSGGSPTLDRRRAQSARDVRQRRSCSNWRSPATYQLAMANSGADRHQHIAVLHHARSNQNSDAGIRLHALRPVADRCRAR